MKAWPLASLLSKMMPLASLLRKMMPCIMCCPLRHKGLQRSLLLVLQAVCWIAGCFVSVIIATHTCKTCPLLTQKQHHHGPLEADTEAVPSLASDCHHGSMYTNLGGALAATSKNDLPDVYEATSLISTKPDASMRSTRCMESSTIASGSTRLKLKDLHATYREAPSSSWYYSA